MSVAFIVLTLAAFALAALATSLTFGVPALVAERTLRRLEPRAAVRVWTVIAIAPAVIGALSVVLALAPSFGWGIDHCQVHEDHHPHLCLTHAHLHGGAALIVVAAALFSRVLVAALATVRATVRANAVRHTLAALSRSDDDGVLVPAAEPLAATLGFWRPRAFVSTGVPAAVRPAVIAHELAHVRHKDPAARALLDVALALHAPGVASLVRRALHRAHEMRADAAAADSLGDPASVAEALVAMARLSRAAQLPGASAFEGDVAIRVANLLDERPRRALAWPVAVALAIVLVVATLLVAQPVHHWLESALGLLGA